jgi:Soluble lytic murein transglycosylase and related regulatory proteins (some contain LysM/invasin domains)
MKIKDIISYCVMAILTIAVIYSIILSNQVKCLAQDPVKNEQMEMTAHDMELPDSLFFAGEEVPLSMFYIREKLERELLSNSYFHSNTLLLLKRSTRWLPTIDSILAANRIPYDFRYLAMIESNLTNAVSPSGAVGFWQFMPATAKDFGLQVEKEIDMRYNVELETVAACKYFLKSYERFHSWTLVAASYNAGMGRISKFREEQGVNSYYDMLLAEETERYVFRILALKLITENPQKYGFFVSEHLTYSPMAYKTVTVSQPVKSWAVFAKEHGITYKLLKLYNPWLRSKGLANETGQQYQIKIPLPPFDLTHEKYLEQKEGN